MTFLITGAGRGLGLEFTEQLLAKNHSVYAMVRDAGKAPQLSSLQKKYGDHLQIMEGDVSSDKSVAQVFEKIKTPIDVLINNAGILLDAEMNFSTMPLDIVEKTFAVNVLAPMRMTKAALPQLQKSSKPVLINISSLMGSMADNTSGNYYAYRMSKAALNMFAKSFSVDYPKIKTINLHPGWVQTDMGGAGAAISPEESITGLLAVILNSDKYKSGSFINYKGQELPW